MLGVYVHTCVSARSHLVKTLVKITWSNTWSKLLGQNHLVKITWSKSLVLHSLYAPRPLTLPPTSHGCFGWQHSSKHQAWVLHMCTACVCLFCTCAGVLLQTRQVLPMLSRPLHKSHTSLRSLILHTFTRRQSTCTHTQAMLKQVLVQHKLAE